MSKTDRKPLGGPSYGSIPHLPNSRVGPSDHSCEEGQARIATVKPRDSHDEIIVQEKVDGSNVGVALVSGTILAITRAGYLATTSPFEQHHYWADWVRLNEARFRAVLREGERVCGEWLMQAHGTRYALLHEPLVLFDLMVGHNRMTYDAFLARVAQGHFITPHLLHRGYSCSVPRALEFLGEHGFHGAIDQAEGVVWRVERNELMDKRHGGPRIRRVDFLVKYVRPDKTDGIYLPEISNQEPIWNYQPWK